MKLCDAISRYISYKQAIGMVFETEATILRAFTEKVGVNMPVAKITSDYVLQYLNGRGPVTLFWHRKHDALSGFWRFAIQHGWTDRSPVPAAPTQGADSFHPLYLLATATQATARRDLNFPTKVAQAGADHTAVHPINVVRRGPSH
jgi:hypothetical protein